MIYPAPNFDSRRRVKAPAKAPATLQHGRFKLKPSPGFDTYWRFAAERQAIFFRRMRGDLVLTDDPILSAHRFTNAYRASDRVSQYLISKIIPGSTGPEDTVFRALLFKIFNRIDTWRYLEANLGEIHLEEFSVRAYDRLLEKALSADKRIYSAAYIMPSPNFGNERKHSNHLALLQSMMRSKLPDRLADCSSLKEVYELLISYPSLGKFLAFQFAIDLNYSNVLKHSENDFVVAGPGAIDGIRKCFADVGTLSSEDIIRVMAEIADEQFRRLGIDFHALFGRPLHLIDCQNLFCEVDKYCRVAHPELSGASGRTRIKQRYARNDEPFAVAYPDKWALDTSRIPTALTLITSAA